MAPVAAQADAPKGGVFAGKVLDDAPGPVAGAIVDEQDAALGGNEPLLDQPI